MQTFSTVSSSLQKNASICGVTPHFSIMYLALSSFLVSPLYGVSEKSVCQPLSVPAQFCQNIA